MKNIRKIIVFVPASLIGNLKGELRSPCVGNEYLINVERKRLNKLHPSYDEYKIIKEKSDKRIEKYYDIMSYNRFVQLH